MNTTIELLPIANPAIYGNIQECRLPISCKRLLGFYVKSNAPFELTVRDSYSTLIQIFEFPSSAKILKYKKKLRSIKRPARGNQLIFEFASTSNLDISIHAELEC